MQIVPERKYLHFKGYLTTNIYYSLFISLKKFTKNIYTQ